MKCTSIKQITKAELIEKKSRFIATLYPIDSEEDGYAHLEAHRRQNKEANHNCWAMITGIAQKTERASDDGEPSGTAGKPMLDLLRGAELTNVLVVVTRYFGGTLLGTGGLVRAYSEATRQAIQNAEIITKLSGVQLSIQIEYPLLGKVQHYLEHSNVTDVQLVYSNFIDITFLVTDMDKDRMIHDLEDLTHGTVIITELQMCWVTAFELA